MDFLKGSALSGAIVFLAACSGGSPSSVNTGPVSDDIPPITSEGRAGENLDIYLTSNLDGETIAITVMEPPFVVAGQTAPLILHSHGYSGSRARSPDAEVDLTNLHNAGFGILSLDERGNGESGGTVRILDPAFEGQDWLQVLDWAEENLPWLRYENASNQEVAKDAAGANPVMGGIGSSYGGGFQHLVYALDPKHRLDALSPDITWHDLRYSLMPGGVFKSQWATILAGLGSAPPNTQDQEVQEGLTQGLTTNSLDDEKLALLYRNSLASHCAGENEFTAPDGLQPIDVFYSQSHLDTLFNFNDAYNNYQCINALGGDVRFMLESAGHGLDNGDGTRVCNNLTRTDARLAWFQEKLLHQAGAADAISDICLQLGNTAGDSIVVNEIQVGNAAASVDIGTTTVTLGSAGTAPQYVTVYDGAVDGANVLAGIPTLDATLEIPLGGCAASDAQSTQADPIVFIGLGIRTGAQGQVTLLQSQMMPFRRCKTNELVELVGVTTRVADDQQVVLVLQGDFSPQYSGNSTNGSGVIDVSGELRLPLLGDVPSAESGA